MATKHSSSAEKEARKINRDERGFWRAAFLAAEVPLLMKRRARNLSPIGAAHLAADFADAAVTEYRRRRWEF